MQRSRNWRILSTCIQQYTLSLGSGTPSIPLPPDIPCIFHSISRNLSQYHSPSPNHFPNDNRHSKNIFSTHHPFSTLSPPSIDITTYDVKQGQNFIDCFEYLLPKLAMPPDDIEELLINVTDKGFRNNGQMFTRTSPAHLDLYNTIKPLIEFLESVPGVNLTRTLRSSPHILMHSTDAELLAKNAAWLTRELDLQGTDLGKMVNGNAYILGRSVETTVKPCIKVLRGLGFSTDEIRSIFVRFSRVLALKNDRMEHSLRILKDINLHDEQIKTIIWKFPAIFALSRGKVEASLAWLKDQGLYSSDIILNCITRFPSILSFSITAKLDPMVELLKQLGLEEDTRRNILLYAPDTFGRKKELILMNYQVMKDVGFDPEQLTRFLRAYPGALRANLHSKTYLPKLKYLEERLGKDVPSTLATHPMYITYNLERIISRAEFLMKMNRPTSALTGWLSSKDDIFAEKHAMSTIDEWNHFKSMYRH